VTPHRRTVVALFLATASAFAAEGTAAQTAAPRAPLARRDSTRLLKAAHRAQGDFERLRRRLLPAQPGLSGRSCRFVIGRYCHTSMRDESPPAESPRVVAKRTWLIATLDSLGRALPGDRWILAQRLRYRMELGRTDESRAIADECARRAAAGDLRRWCLALAGYAAQELGDYAGADSAFAAALAAMSEKERCGWEDMSLLLDGETADRFKHLGCAARDTMAAALWRVVQPLYLTGVNDLRTEFLARVTRMRIEQDARGPMSAYQGADDRETLLRFGGGLWYTQETRDDGSGPSTVVASHRRGPAFDFFPEAGVLASLDRLRLGDWTFAALTPRVGYAPGYAQKFRPLEHQLAVFRRGDSALVVGAFDVSDDANFGGGGLQAGLFAAPIAHGGVAPPIGGEIPTEQRAAVATMYAPWQPMLVSLEVLDREFAAAARARYAVALPAGGAQRGLSDVLLYAPHGTVPATLADAIPHALHQLRSTRTVRLGLFWESYGARTAGEPVDFALVVVPTGDGRLRRAFDKLRRKEKRSLAMHWREVPAVADGVAPRALELDVSLLRPGRYRIQLLLDASSATPVIATREIELVEH
jgi:hypothetical protein